MRYCEYARSAGWRSITITRSSFPSVSRRRRAISGWCRQSGSISPAAVAAPASAKKLA